jgi:hypothetical protein
MRLIRPIVRLGGWLVVVIAAIVALIAFFAAGNPNTRESFVSWVVVLAALLASGGTYWLLQRTAGPRNDPGVRYQPSSVLEELAVPVLTKINEGSRPFTRGGIGIITFGAWLVAVVVLASTWAGVAMLLGLIMIGIAAAFEAVGIVLPEPVGWFAAIVVLVVPIAVVVLVYQWAVRRPAIRYWLR